MIDITELSIGDKVRYQPEHYGDKEWESGIIKEIREDNIDGVWVVYDCNGDWRNYKDYTSALTNLRDLKLGWKCINKILAVAERRTSHLANRLLQSYPPMTIRDALALSYIQAINDMSGNRAPEVVDAMAPLRKALTEIEDE